MRRMVRTVVAVAGVALTTLLLFAGTPALASGEKGYPPPPKPTVIVQAPSPPAAPVQSQVAFTGTNVLRWAVVALLVMVVGAVLVLVSRRRSRVTA